MTNDIDTSTSTKNERLLAVFSHLSILIPRIVFTVPIGFIVPIIIWVVQVNQKSKSQYATFQSFQAFTYQLCVIAIGFIGYSFSMLSVFAFNTYLMFPIMTINSIVEFILTAYGIWGAIMTFQGKPFHYWIIGNQIEHFMPAINQKPSRIYIALIIFVFLYVLFFAAYFFIALIGQANA
jgi:hypothetical protein